MSSDNDKFSHDETLRLYIFGSLCRAMHLRSCCMYSQMNIIVMTWLETQGTTHVPTLDDSASMLGKVQSGCVCRQWLQYVYS